LKIEAREHGTKQDAWMETVWIAKVRNELIQNESDLIFVEESKAGWWVL
jgi:hypothetical protein